MPTRNRPPIGLTLNRTARIVSRAFDEALTEAGRLIATWLVLLNVETEQASTQRSLAGALGLREPTLSHHLAAMESDGPDHPSPRRRQPPGSGGGADRRGSHAVPPAAHAAIAFDRQAAQRHRRRRPGDWSTRSSPGCRPTSAEASRRLSVSVGAQGHGPRSPRRAARSGCLPVGCTRRPRFGGDDGRRDTAPRGRTTRLDRPAGRGSERACRDGGAPGSHPGGDADPVAQGRSDPVSEHKRRLTRADRDATRI